MEVWELEASRVSPAVDVVGVVSSFSVSVSASVGVDGASSDESSDTGEDAPSRGYGDGDRLVSSGTTLSSELAGLPPCGLFIMTVSREYGTGRLSVSSWLRLLRSERELRELPWEWEYEAGRPSASATATSSSGSLEMLLSVLELASRKCPPRRSLSLRIWL